jgi:hypothetical protein
MRATDKFRTDASRWEGRPVNDGEALSALRFLFSRFLPGMPNEFVSDAFEAFLENSGRDGERFTARDIDRLSGIASALLGDYDGSELYPEDWVGIREAASAASDVIPIDTLTDIMALVMEKGALS